ncbi:conserved hypothetical protein [Perkinsus marinus ATCC 50983]|uniref:Uncharacterized protein n=1 Tax=Perkinsus marinus (strain ATCC 50983 / TXsc) TaxID=423536 RepID=C5LIS9_PERM5|nr:conserved hypothetical protein [Perkinsus marinus ATCC 50983]EER03482.1 conserved hypothetical protein [Perkinsus marinus ATCC 50983]|eukprot:XP_002771666.1 conserved hypothetical protein [Perkinsus marinus ATCC 50983]
MRQSGFFQLQTPVPLLPYNDNDKLLKEYEVHNTFVDFRGPRPLSNQHSTAPAAVFRTTRMFSSPLIPSPPPIIGPPPSPNRAITQSPFNWADEVPGESTASFAMPPTPPSAATAPTVAMGDWSPFVVSRSRWTPPKRDLPESTPELRYAVPSASSWVTTQYKRQKPPPPELRDISPGPPPVRASCMVVSSPTVFNATTSCSPIGPPAVIDWSVESIYSPASLKWDDGDMNGVRGRHSFYPPRRRLFQQIGPATGTILEDVSPSVCSPVWNGDGVRCAGIPPYSPSAISANTTSPASMPVYHPSTNTEQDDYLRYSAWTVIWIDEVAFKSDSKVKKDSLAEKFKITVKAYKSSEKCIRAFEKRCNKRPPARGQKQMIVVSESNAMELLDYLHKGREWLAPKLFILGPTSSQLRRKSRLITATVRNWGQLIGLIGRTLREAS